VLQYSYRGLKIGNMATKKTPVVEQIIDYAADGAALTVNTKALYGFSQIHNDEIRHFPAVYLVISPEWNEQLGGNRFGGGPFVDVIKKKLGFFAESCKIDPPVKMSEFDNKLVVRMYFIKTPLKTEALYNLLHNHKFNGHAIVDDVSPIPFERFEHLLETAKTKNDPQHALLKGLVEEVAHKAHINNAEIFRRLSDLSGISSGTIAPVYYGYNSITHPLANAAVTLAHVPKQLISEYLDTMTGIPHARELTRALVQGDMATFKNARLMNKRDQTMFAVDTFHAGHIVGLYRRRNGLSLGEMPISRSSLWHFENGDTNLDFDQATTCAELMELRGEDKRAFVVSATGHRYLTHTEIVSAIKNMRTDSPQWESSLREVFHQTGKTFAEITREWGLAQSSEYFVRASRGEKHSKTHAQYLATRIGFADHLREEFIDSYNKALGKKSADELLQMMENKQITASKGLSELIKLSGTQIKDYCNNIGVSTSILKHEFGFHNPNVQASLPALIKDLKKAEPDLDELSFMRRLQSIHASHQTTFANRIRNTQRSAQNTKITLE